jgi:hypothetical protein
MTGLRRLSISFSNIFDMIGRFSYRSLWFEFRFWELLLLFYLSSCVVLVYSCYQYIRKFFMSYTLKVTYIINYKVKLITIYIE